MTKHEQKIEELVVEFWNTMGSMFDVTYNLICDCYEDKKTSIKPELIEAAKIVIINCTYEIRDNPKTEQKINNDYEWKQKFIEKFMLKTNKYWGEIDERKDTFFLNKAGSMFSNFNTKQVNSFRVLFGKDQNGVENVSGKKKNELWDIFIDMLAIGIEITHLRRDPYMKGNKKSYKIRHLPSVKLVEYAKKWEADLSY